MVEYTIVAMDISNKKVKVLILSHSSEIGGAELSMLDFFDFWTKQNSELELLFIVKYPLDKLGPELKKRNWQFKVVDYGSWSSRNFPTDSESIYRNGKRNGRATLEILDNIESFNPDIVMTNTIVAPWAAIASKLLGKKHIWFVREYGDIDHGHDFELGREKMFEDIGIMSELVVTNSVALKKHIASFIDANKIVPLYTPFNVDKIISLSKKKIKSPFSVKGVQLKAVIAGVIKPSKGQEKAIEAVALLKRKGINVELCIVGQATEPEYFKRIKQLTQDLGVSKQIHFVGRQSNPYAYMEHADIGIMASKMEAFGRVTFEYLCLGKPVVGSAEGGTVEMVRDAYNGFLYSSGDVEKMAVCLEAYALDVSKLKEHQINAKTSALHMISGEYGAKELISKINTLISSDLPPYRLPNYAKKWIEFPGAVTMLRSKSTLKHKISVARNLGVKNTYHEVHKRVRSKVQQRRNIKE